MSSYILDTHVMLWIANDSDVLTDNVRDIFLDPKNTFAFSIASIWEMAIKISLKKLTLPCSLDSFVEHHVRDNNIKLLSMKTHHCYMLEKLPYYHRDPFDRIIVAQAIQESHTLISKDSALRKYEVKTYWQ